MLVVWLLVAAALPRISIQTPRVVNIRDQYVRIECRVARHPDNRYLRIGLVDVAASDRQIDGADASVVHELIVRAFPCEPELTAYCILLDRHGQTYVARQAVRIFPCGETFEIP